MPQIPENLPGKTPLVQKDVEFHRGGTTFTERRMVRVDDAGVVHVAKNTGVSVEKVKKKTANVHGSKWIRPEKRASIYEADGHKCVYCGKDLSDEKIQHEHERTLDHLIPRSLGGSHGAHNLLTACGSCNSARQNLSIKDWNKLLKSRGINGKLPGRITKAIKQHAKMYMQDLMNDLGKDIAKELGILAEKEETDLEDITFEEAISKAMRGMPSRASMVVGGQALTQQANKSTVNKPGISVGKASNTVGVKPTGHATMPSNAKPGLVEKDVEFHRGGTTFTEKRMVRTGEELPQQGGVKPQVEETKPETKESEKSAVSETKPEFEIPKEHKEQLNKHIKAAKGMKPGETREVNNVSVKAMGNSRYGVGSRHPILVHGLRGLSLIVDKLGSLSTTGGAMMVGDIQGKTVKQGIGAQQLERTGEAKVGAIEQQQRIAQQGEERDKKLGEFLEKREETDRQRAIKDRYMKQKRVLIADDTARKVKLNKLDSMSDNQVTNLAVRMNISVHDEQGTMYPISDLRNQVRAKALEAQKDLPEEKEEKKPKVKPETKEKFEDKPAIDKQADAVVTLTDQAGVTQKEEKPGGEAPTVAAERKQAKTIEDTGVKVVSAKELHGRLLKDLSEDELKVLAKHAGIDVEGRSIEGMRQAIKQAGHDTMQGQAEPKHKIEPEAKTVEAKPEVNETKPEEKHMAGQKPVKGENESDLSYAARMQDWNKAEKGRRLSASAKKHKDKVKGQRSQRSQDLVDALQGKSFKKQ